MTDGPGAGGRRRLLMIAYHFPPLVGSSGIQRTLRFVQHLPALGWEPLVLTATASAYERTSDDLMREVPAGAVVERALALDTARHLSFRGRYVGALARPDRWATWKFDAVRRGLRMIADYRPDAIWSTFPIPTAHAIGLSLARRSGLPWIADFRDPMAQEGYPADPQLWRAFDQLERGTVARASRCVFTTPGAKRQYAARYPDRAEHFSLIENGYDEESFIAAEAQGPLDEPLRRGAVTLLHSGIVYPAERDPEALFRALGRLKQQGLLRAGFFALRFRSPVHDALLHTLAARYDVADLIEVLPPMPYQEALREMLRADGLLLMQGASCNEQIPAKTYEYLRARRPLLCLADPSGDTAAAVRKAGIDSIAALEHEDGIVQALAAFMERPHAGRASVAGDDAVRDASRTGRTAQLVRLLEQLPRQGR